MGEIRPKAVGGKACQQLQGQQQSVLKCGNGTLHGIDTVVVQWDQLDVHLVGSDVLLNRLGALVVHHIQCWLVITSTEYHKHFEEGGN